MEKSIGALIRTGTAVFILAVAMGVAAPRDAYAADYNSINQWYYDNYNPANYATIITQSNLDTLRASLINFLWKGNGLPAALPSTIWQNVALPPPLWITDNFLRADRMEIIRPIPGTSERFIYHLYVFRPSVKSSNKVSIVMPGHNWSMDATGIGPTIRALVSAGITVVSTWMPSMSGECIAEWGNYPTHDAIGTLESPTFAAVTLFIDHLIIGLNQMQKENMGPFSMIGVSGGGWTTTIMAAVDTRIKLSYDVAGSTPLAVSMAGPSAWAGVEFEQTNGLGAMYSRASYEDLYILGSAGAGRRHVQALNRIDGQCFWGIYFNLWQPLVSKRAGDLGGQYAVHSYDYPVGSPGPGLHYLDDSTRNLFLADLGVTATAPNITAQPASVAVTAGQMATFGVTATGAAPLTYQWRKNGSNISGATAASYTTPATSLADSGALFSVVVSNSLGSVTSANATLTVNSVSNQPPLIDSAPWANPNPVTLPSTTTVNVLAHDPDGGPQALSYTWSTVSGPATAAFSPNGTAGSASSSASFPAAGSYTLRVTISDGVANVAGNVAVTVNASAAPPSITAQPSSVAVAAGQTASFSVTATGTAPLAYQWRKNGVNISGAASASYTTPATATADSGSVFSVVITNSVGSATSSGAVLTVTALSTAVFVQADTATQGSWKGKYGADGYNVIANAASYPAYATVSASGKSDWTWNSSTADIRALQKAGAATDRIAACWYSAGSFTVDVNLTDGQTHRLALYCLDWDTTVRRQRIEVLDAGTSAVLDTQNLSASFTNGIYLVWDIRGSVKIRFTCTGPYNTVLSGLFFGAASATAPAITAQPVSQAVVAGQSASFSVTATGTAPLAYQWKKGGVNISGATSASYTTPATTSADSGSVFSVVVTNSAGSATSSGAVLTVTAPPTGLLLCWKLDDATGTVAADASGNGRNGTLAGGPAWSTGQLNGALAFDGIDDRVEQTGFQSALNGLSAITLAMWVKSDEVNTDRGFLLGKDPDGSDSVLGLRYDAEGYSGGGVNVIKAALTVSGTDLALESSSGKQTTAWRHVVLTWSSGQKLALYVDGVLDTPTYNSPAVSGTVSGVTKFLVGRGCKDTPGGWKGKLDDVRVYNGALSATQVLALYNGAP